MPEAPVPEVTVVLPCLNEAATVAGCIREAQLAFAAGGLLGEVVVADNGSTDGSQAIAARAGARVVAVAERGYGNALLAGFSAARGRYIVMGDADASYDFGAVPSLVAPLREGADVVMGNRFAGRIHPGAMPWKNRYVGNPALSGIGRLFFHCPVHDLHCGLRAFTREAIQRLDLRTGGMEFASEMVIKATLFGLRMVEVPVDLRPDGRGRAPHLRPWRDGWRHLRFMLLFSPRWLFLLPGLALMLVGVGLSLRLFAGPLPLGPITLGVHTLFYAAIAVLMGFQSVAFAGLTKVYAIQAGLVPPRGRIARVVHWFSFEKALGFGAVLILLGLTASLRAVDFWGEQGFGNLAGDYVLRWAIAGGLFLALGAQAMLVGFFLSILSQPLVGKGERC